MKKIILSVLFLASILVISGCGVQESPYAMDEKRSGGSAVTYQGVLNMLNSCEIIKSSGPSSTYNCDTICGDRGTCVTALFSDWQYDFHGTGDGVIYSEQVKCDKDIGINPPDMEALYCTCCSP